ncbi:MAG TPA: PfkB family carbohydrate kinase [Acetobacteraceae bacterium]|nr:PfkB family carbohydrate kinase [Acetobacteraceae bacterium]
MDHAFWVDEVALPPSKTRASAYKVGAGGLSANASIAVQRLGGQAVFWGRVGDDPNGPMLLEALNAEGIDTGSCRLAPGGRTPVSAVLVDRVGERSIFAFRGEGLGTDPSWLPLDRLAGARSVLTDPRWVEGAAALLEAARARGIPSVLDGEKSETRLLLDLVPRVDHAIFSVPGLANYAPGLRPADALRRALDQGCQVAAVTRGEDGTLWMMPGDERPRTMPAFRVAAHNTTGAGDVFHGAYALAIAEGQPPERAMRFASAAGALRARDGETPDRAMVEAMLRGA